MVIFLALAFFLSIKITLFFKQWDMLCFVLIISVLGTNSIELHKHSP